MKEKLNKESCKTVEAVDVHTGNSMERKEGANPFFQVGKNRKRDYTCCISCNNCGTFNFGRNYHYYFTR